MLDEICRTGAQRMLEVALEEEVAEYVERHNGELDEAGHRLVVRNGHGEPRTVTTVAGTFEVSAPGERPTRRSRQRRTASLQELAAAAVVPSVAEGDRGAAAALSARAVDEGLHPGARGVLRRRGRVVPLGRYPSREASRPITRPP